MYFSDLQSTIDHMHSELIALRDRQEQAKLDWLHEHEERITEVQNLYERRQQMLQEENDRLRDEMDTMREQMSSRLVEAERWECSIVE